MIKKIVFGLIWFAVIFLVIYTTGGFLYVYVNNIDTGGGMKTAVEAGRAFRAAYLSYILIGSFILTLSGTLTGIFPGTKTKSTAK